MTTDFNAPKPAAVEASEAEGGVLATARHAGYGTTFKDLSDTDVVNVHGVDMTLAQAARLGYVVKEGDSYRDATKAELIDREVARQTIEDNAAARERAEIDPVEFDGQTAVRLQTVFGHMSELGMHPAGLISAMLARPDAVPEQLTVVARERGLSEEDLYQDALAAAAQVQAALEAKIVNKYGLGEEALNHFHEWCNSRRTLPYRMAIMQAVTTGDARPMAKLVNEYKLATKIDWRPAFRDDYEGATFGEAKVGTRTVETVEVKLGDKKMITSVAAARRLGLLG